MNTEDQTEPILHPWTIASIVVLFINDQYLKYAYTSWLTGKLSDFAGLIFFPILFEPLVKSRKWSVIITGIGFALVQTDRGWKYILQSGSIRDSLTFLDGDSKCHW